MYEHDFALERTLQEKSPELHARFNSVVFSSPYILTKYKTLFPTFTDHSIIHSLNVIEFCNKIIGDQIDKMNVDEIYVLLLGSYLHDTGMGVSKEDYEEFTPQIDFGTYFDNHSKDDVPAIVRSFHHEYSGLFIKKYAKFFDFPSEEYMHAVAQVARGHRKVDLENKKEYPIEYPLPNGNTICLPYLAALVRLADEIDVTAARNCLIDFKLTELTDEIDIIEFAKHEAVKELVTTDKEFIVKVETEDKALIKELEKLVEKMQKTLNLCRHAVNGVTKFTINQERVILDIKKAE